MFQCGHAEQRALMLDGTRILPWRTKSYAACGGSRCVTSHDHSAFVSASQAVGTEPVRSVVMSTPLQGFPLAASASVQVDAGAIHSYATRQISTTANDTQSIASSVRRLGSGDVNAFGVCLAQVLGIPSQIALGVAARNLEKLSEGLADFAVDLGRVADRHEQTEQGNRLIAHGVARSR